MGVQWSKCRKESEDEQVSQKILVVDKFVFLPDDIISDILQRLPNAFLLRYKAKYVCRRWFDIITNRILLDHVSFILHKSSGTHTARLVDIREEQLGLEVKEECFDIPCRGRIESWCYEFLLIRDLDKKACRTYVFSLITKEISYLSWCKSCVEVVSRCRCNMAISFDVLKGVHKVLHVVIGPPMQCHILIFKSDIVTGVFSKWKKIKVVSSKWKKIKVPDYMWQGMYTWSHPVSVQGKYFHWSATFYNYLISMDMVKEKIFQLHLPIKVGYGFIKLYALCEMRGFLTLIGGGNWDKPHIWILKYFQRMEWMKFQSVTFPDRHWILKYIICKDPSPGNSMYSYDLNFGVVKELNINIEFDEYCLVHKSSPSLYSRG